MHTPAGILVEIKGNGALGREETLMASLAAQRHIPVHRASLKQIERARVGVPPGVVAVGSVPFVNHALRQLGRMLPDAEPYPLALAPLLHRRVRKLRTLQEARRLLALGERLFVKPAVGWKRFTGFVPEFEDDPRFNGASGSAPVWVSEVVRFVSEWRAYIANDTLLDVRFVDHGGDRGLPPDRAVIEKAVQTLSSSKAAPAG